MTGVVAAPRFVRREDGYLGGDEVACEANGHKAWGFCNGRIRCVCGLVSWADTGAAMWYFGGWKLAQERSKFSQPDEGNDE